MKDSLIYLDFAAATPLDERVFASMQPYFSEQFYNPSAAYAAARQVREAYETARASLAAQIGAKPQDVIITAGATESANLALQGVMKAYSKSNVAISAIEHQAVLSAAKQYSHQLIEPDHYGRITEKALQAAVDDNTVLVSVGMVNSEIGTKQPIKKLTDTIQRIREERRRRGVELPLYFHTDGSQAAGTEQLQVARLGVDMMTLSASKIYGPKQSGLLYVNRNVHMQPLMHGGGQERNLRSGTENVAATIGFATALELAGSERRERSKRTGELRETFITHILKELPEAQVTVPASIAAPHILHLSLPGIDAERLLFMLDEHGVMIATGAACAANEQTGSYVLKAIGASEAAIQGSIRCSFGHTLSYGEIEQAARIFADCVRELKEAT